jgi:DNA/RNA endonuclease G (NUC1)
MIFGLDPKTIGKDHVAVPDAYWKIIFSPSAGKASNTNSRIETQSDPPDDDSGQVARGGEV